MIERIAIIDVQQRPQARLRGRCLAAFISILVLLLLPRGGWAFSATQRGNQLLLDGVPTALTFAWGCTDVAMLPDYRALGFNTLLLRIDSLGTEELEKDVALAQAAADAQMFVLIELANGSWSTDEYVDLGNAAYLESVKYYLDTVIPRLQQNPRLIGWVISTVEEGRLISDAGTFRQFLLQKYITLGSLNDAWSAQSEGTGSGSTAISSGATTYRSKITEKQLNMLDEKTALLLCNPNPLVQKLVKNDINDYHQRTAARDSDFQQYLRMRYPGNDSKSLSAINACWDFHFARYEDIHIQTILRREQEKPGSSPFSLLEVARYQSLTPTLLMSWWAEQVTSRDQNHLIFAGAQRSYRTLVGLPSKVHAIVSSQTLWAPYTRELVDSSATVNGIVTECYPGVAEADRENHNPQAIDLARHGNRFIVLAGILARYADALHYSDYLYTGPLHGAAGIGVSDFPTLMASLPHQQVTKIALHDITERQLLNRIPTPSTAIVYDPSSLGLLEGKRSLYGFAPGLGYYSPGLVMFYLRNGTRYGQIDYLAANDLPQILPARYQTIVLPAVFDLPIQAQTALLSFVDGGGTVVGDLGIGMFQAFDASTNQPDKPHLYAMPLLLQALFGVKTIPGLAEVRLNLDVYRPHPYFLSLFPGFNSTGIGTGYAIMHIAQAIPLPGTDLLFQTIASTTIGQPVLRPYKPLPPQPVSGMFIAKHGKGFAIYASFPLYQCWTPLNLLFNEFHSDLLCKGAQVSLRNPDIFLPLLCEVASYADGSVALWTRDQMKPAAEIINPLHRIYAAREGWCEIAPRQTTVAYERAGYSTAQPLPIFLGDAVTYPVRFHPLHIAPQALSFQVETKDEYAEHPLTLRIAPGSAILKPGITHHVMMLAHGTTQYLIAQPDAQGGLTVTLPCSRCQFIITDEESTIAIEQPAVNDHKTDNSQEIEIHVTTDEQPNADNELQINTQPLPPAFTLP